MFKVCRTVGAALSAAIIVVTTLIVMSGLSPFVGIPLLTLSIVLLCVSSGTGLALAAKRLGANYWGTAVGLVVFALFYGVFFNLLVAPHPLTLRIIDAYWLWWFALLTVASAAEGSATFYLKRTGAPDWGLYPFAWGPNHEAVMLPVWLVIAIEVTLRWSDFANRVTITPANLESPEPFVRWAAGLVVQWGNHGSFFAELLGTLVPLVVLFAAYLVVGNVVIQAVRQRLEVGG